MSINNSLAPQKQRLGIGAYLSQDAIKNRINEVVGGKDGQRLITSIVSATTNNPQLQECTNQSILAAAMVGEGLKLSPSPQLGHFYMVPYNNRKEGVKEAQFQLGYKGYIQLAIRSGQYKKLNVLAIKKDELEYFDPLNEEIKINLNLADWNAREESETIGYYAMFELVNGFKKAIYWSKEQMLSHADRFSMAFSKDATGTGKYARVSFADYQAGKYNTKDEWLYSSFWYKDFDGMAYKTMLRQLISKWGIMSIDMQTAFESDMAVINDDAEPKYVDNVDSDNIVESKSEVIEESQKVETTASEEVGSEPVKEDAKAPESVQEALFGAGEVNE